MKESEYRSYDDLPLFLNSATVAKVLGVSPSSGYELMHEPGFPVLRISSYPDDGETPRTFATVSELRNSGRSS